MCEWNNQVILKAPDFVKKEGRETVCIDECIAPTIQKLWEYGIETEGCCCGHGKDYCTLIIPHSYSPYMLYRCYSLLETIDNRRWSIMQWRLVEVAAKPEDEK